MTPSPVNVSKISSEPIDKQQLTKLLQDLRHFREETEKTQHDLFKDWKPLIHVPDFLDSAANMAAYIGLRRQDIRESQTQLAAIGLSSLGRTEGHVLANLDAVIRALDALTGAPTQLKKVLATAHSFDENDGHLARRTNGLFGTAPKHRSVRIMVTFPSEAATDYLFVRDLVLRGMDCARINCAHDSPDEWKKMVEHVRQAEQETGRNCKVMMDLAGPKLRTGPIAMDQGIVHLRPARNNRGIITAPATLILDSSGRPGCNVSKDGLGRRLPARLNVAADWLQRLQQDDHIKFSDLRGKDGLFVVTEKLSKHEVLVTCETSAYLEENLTLRHISDSKHHPVFETFIGPIMATSMTILLRNGDLLELTRKPVPGEPAEIDEADNSIIPAHISCAQPSVLEHLKPGQRVLIDDGHIGTTVESLDEEKVLLRVTRAKAQGSKLMAEKGLNFPDTELDLPALTEKDLRDLDFVAAHADIVGY
ncbi:MAG: pyruvate kinase, partial [Gallionella sp.]|nr:pyruvate kinase [Gallionella sp.]